MPESGQLMKSPGRLLGFDYGSQRIGVAVGNRITCTAEPLHIIHNRRSTTNWLAILAIINEWKPETLLIGLPLSPCGKETELSGKARWFGKKLSGKCGLDFIMIDERYSTYQANEVIANLAKCKMRRKSSSIDRDDIAALVILETYFAEIKNQTVSQHGQYRQQRH